MKRETGKGVQMNSPKNPKKNNNLEKGRNKKKAGKAQHESDLESNRGFWLVTPDPDDPNWCTVNYSVAISLKSWAPTWLDSIIAVQGLPKAVTWVKRESEKGLKRRIQSAPDLTRLVG